MRINHLGTTDFDRILDSFLLAFQNYFVNVPRDRNYYRKRWEAAKVDFNFSYGMFDGEKLVGFVIHAIDRREGRLTAFNTGTGVIPGYRGQRIVQSIYAYAFEDLKQIGVTHFALEVITKNEIAIRCYQGIGFATKRTYKCFKGEIGPKANATVTLKEVDVQKVDWSGLPNQGYYSWDHQKETLLNSSYTFYQVRRDDRLEGFFVIDPHTGYVAQFDVFHADKNTWKSLFSGIRQISQTIKVNNVDKRLTEKLVRLEAYGLMNSVDQYEMRMDVPGTQ